MSKKTSSPTKNLESRIQNLESSLARALADYANLEKRFQRDSSSVIKFANSSVLEKLLTFRDHLALTTTSLNDPGLTLLLGELDQILKDEDVIEIDTAKGFDPSGMECTELVPGEKDTIVSVTRRGYRLHDRVLRPARVTMGNGIVNKSLIN